VKSDRSRRVLFDARWVRPGMTGVGHYAYNILRSPAIPREKCGVIVTRDCPYLSAFEGYRIITTAVDLIDHPATDLFEQFMIPWLCHRHGYGNFVSFEGRSPILHPGIRTFPVIYDLSYLRVKGSHSRKYAFFLGLHARLNSLFATAIPAISETARRDIMKTLGVPEKRTFTAYPAGSRLADHAPIAVPGLEKPFFLVVGATNPRKNLPAVLKAMGEIRPQAGLAVTGNAGLIEADCKAIGAEGVRNLGFVGEGELRWLYENAAGLVFASRDEGFGIPLIDAAEFGCPVLCSDIPVFREVMRDSARYFDPDAPSSIAAAMRSVLEGNRPKADAPQTRFSWDKSALAFMERMAP
jgi:glycosyltransferase involved in cell wall biosynthesis